eukprot:jgi/Mesvir1/29217/Mv20411-RA.1
MANTGIAAFVAGGLALFLGQKILKRLHSQNEGVHKPRILKLPSAANLVNYRSDDQTSLSQLCASMKIPCGILWKPDAEGVLRVVGKYVTPGDRITYCDESEKYSFEAGQGAVGRAFKTKKGQWFSNVQNLGEDIFKRKQVAIDSSIKTVFCVPIPTGVVEFAAHDEMSIQSRDDWVEAVKNYFITC